MPRAGAAASPVSGPRVRGRRVLLALAAATCALAGSVALTTGEARAYQSFFTPLFSGATADPCEAQGVGGHGGLVVRRQPAIQENDIPRSIALLCSPVYAVPFGTQLADDGIWQRYLRRDGNPPRHMLQGGQDSLPWRDTLSTKDHPAFKGPGGNALGWKDLITIDGNVRDVAFVLGTVIPNVIGAPPTVVLCMLGAIIPGFGFIPCGVGIVATVAVSLVAVFSPDIINLAGRYFQRNDAMNNGQWFVWSSGAGFFNGFGDVDQSWINPSLSTAGDRQLIRVGVVFSNVLLNQGPDFDLSRVGAAETQTPQSRRLGRLVRRMEASHGRTRTGTRRGDRLVGGRRDDYLFAAGGDDRVFGRRGNEVLLQGARGHDRILGGPGNDNIDGHRGTDILAGGPGNDQIIDFFGHTTVYTGRGRDLVAVRDGDGRDTVVCKGPGRKRILADPADRVVNAASRIAGPARGGAARACPARSQVITDGPLPRLGRGY